MTILSMRSEQGEKTQNGLKNPLDPLFKRPELKLHWLSDLHKALLWLVDHSYVLGLLELVSAQNQNPVTPEMSKYFPQCTVILVKGHSPFGEGWKKD